MDLMLIDRIVNAVLYEGYMLYPYRPSAVKNRQRWNFGVLYPESYSAAQGASAANLPFIRASVTSAWAAASNLSASTGSTRCASLTVNAAPAGEFAGPCRASGGNENRTLGVMVVPNSAPTDKSYSAFVRRRTRAGSNSLPEPEPPVAEEPEDAPDPALAPVPPPADGLPPSGGYDAISLSHATASASGEATMTARQS